MSEFFAEDLKEDRNAYDTVLDFSEPPEKKEKNSFRAYICMIIYQLFSNQLLQQLRGYLI